MAEQIIEYPTHRLIIQEIENSKFIKVTNYVEGEVYQNMLDSIFIVKEMLVNFVSEERILLNNFLRSLVSFHNKEKNLLLGHPEMYVFIDEAEYYVFCIVNDLPYKEQEWFNTIYIQTSFINSLTLLINASVALIKVVYPECYNKPINLLEESFGEYIKKQEKYKCSIEQYRVFLEKNDIPCLYHFSSRKNFFSIKKNGICSLQELERLQVNVEYSASISSRRIDNNKNLSDYVHLSYERKNPMLYVALAEGRLADYVIFEITPEVIFLKETKFSNMNAAKNGAKISSDIDFFLQIPFKCFHKKDFGLLSTEEKNWYQSEVLVKNKVFTNQILNL